MSEVNLVERAVYQIIVSSGGFIEDGELKRYLNYVRDDFVGGAKALEEIFKEINSRERNSSMTEVCSVRMRARKRSSNDDCAAHDGMEWVNYHGIVNIAEDAAVADFGSNFDAVELDFFSRLSEEIFKQGHLSSGECSSLRPEKHSRDRAQRLLQSFQADGWLDRNDKNYFVLGPRCFMELRGRFQQTQADALNYQLIHY